MNIVLNKNEFLAELKLAKSVVKRSFFIEEASLLAQLLNNYKPSLFTKLFKIKLPTTIEETRDYHSKLDYMEMNKLEEKLYFAKLEYEETQNRLNLLAVYGYSILDTIEVSINDYQFIKDLINN